ncbi:MAG: T9SS type A sorting domain-containing protein [Ignavibacterium sp.]|nr:T9SS type A sorting domain-containing protein [Ignavibacterium sp.]
MKKFYLIIFTFLLFQPCVLAQYNICPSGSYNSGVDYAYAVDDQVYWASRRDVTGTIITTDGGNTWTINSFTDPKGNPVYCIHAFNADTAFVISSSIYKTTNRGTNWIPVTGVFTNSASFPNTIHFFDQNNGVAMGDPVDGYFEIYTTTNGGSNWVRVQSSNIPPPLTDEAGIVDWHAYYNDSYWFSTNKQRIFRSTDRGYTWNCSQLPSGDYIPSIAFRDELHGLSDAIIESNFFIYKTSDGGNTWTSSALPKWIYGYPHIAYISGTQSTYTINSISYSGNELKKITLFTVDDGLNWYRMDDWGPWLNNDGIGRHQWASVNSGWASSYHSNNEGCIYHWSGYTGKHIWRAGNNLKFGSIPLGEVGDTIQISVGNYGTLPTTVNNLNLSSANFSLVNPPPLPIVLQPWSAIDLDISFTPQTRGLFNESLVINSDAENYSSLSVPLTGKALEFTPPLSDLIYSASDSLYTCTLSNLNASPVGWFEGTQIQGLTIRPVDSVLIGLATAGAQSSMLYKIDPIIGGCVPLITIPLINIRAIAYTPSGTIFAGHKSGALYKINENTGEPLLIGTPSGKVYYSFSFDTQDGKLYASVSPSTGSSKDAIYTIDTLTGAATLVGLTGDGKGTPSIAFNTDGTLYGLKGIGTAINTLITIDKANGHGTEIGSLGKSGLQAIIMRNVVTDVKENNEGTGLNSYALFQNYPNPWNPITTIGYSLKENIQVKLTLLNILGEELTVLVKEEQDKGYHKVDFNGSNLSSGVYFYRLQAGSFVQTRKMILLK